MKETDKPTLIDSGRNYTQSGLVHRVLRPIRSGPHPTVVMLHGRSGTEDVMWIFARTVPANALLVAPRAIAADSGGGYSWYSHADTTLPDLETFDAAVTAVSQFISSLPKLYDADPNRIYLMGFSQGAAAAFAYALRAKTAVQGIAALVGFLPKSSNPATDLHPLASLPVFMAVGEQDERIPLAAAESSAAQLKAAAAALEYRRYATGHKLNSQGMRDLTAWWRARLAK